MTGPAVGRVPRLLVRCGYRHPRVVLAAAFGLIAAGIWLGTHLRFETDVMNLMPRHDPVVNDFKRVLEDFGSLDTLLIAVPIKGDEHLEVGFALVDRLAEELRQCPELTSVQAQVEDPIKLADTVLRNAVLFLDEDGLKALGERLTDAGLQARAADIRASLDTPHGMVEKELAIRDPLGFLPLLLGRLNQAPASLKVDYSSGYFLSGDHTMVLILAKPKGPAQNIDFDQKLMADLEVRIGRAREAVAQDQELALESVPDVLIGGGHRIALEDASLIKRDIASNSLSSILGVMVLFYLAYRRLATVHYAFLPLGTGLATTFIFASLALGELNSATSGFSALLVGLGIDFTIVTYGRYLEGRGRGLSLEEALDEMAVWSGPAVLFGSITTVGTFFAFLATRFSGLREFGLLTGTGIVLMMVAAFLILPAMVALFDRNKAPRAMSSWLNLAPAVSWADSHRRLVLTVAAVLTVASAALLPRLTFDDDVRNLRSPNNQGVAIQERVAKAFGLSFNAMMVRLEGASEAEVLEKAQQLAPELDRLRDSGVISGYESVAKLIPPRDAQERAMAWLKARPELTDPDRVVAVLEAALTKRGLVTSAFADGLATLRTALSPSVPVTLDMWHGTPLQQVVERSMHVRDSRVVSVVNVFTPNGKWRRDAPPELAALVARTPGATLTGVNLVSQRLRKTVWVDAVIAGALGLVLVFALLAWDFRSFREPLLCLLPFALGIVWTLGIMAASGAALNLLNVFVITMIIGVGSDYAIYMVHRSREGASLEELGQTARAVTFSALTTVVGFGSLVTTSYPGLRSMGWMASIGVSLSCALAILVVPLLTPRGRPS